MKSMVTTRKERVVEHHRVDRDLVVVKATTTETVVERSGAVGMPVSDEAAILQFFTTAYGFKAFVEKGDISARINMFFCSPEVREYLRTRGFFYVGDEKGPEISRAVYDEGLACGFDPDRVLRFDFSSHRVYDVNDRPVPTAMSFEYIRGRMVDGRYDLRKAAEHLMTRSDVVLAPPSTLLSNAKRPKDFIHEVPYYNRSSGCDQFLSFTYMPSDEDFRRIHAEVKRSGGRWELSEGAYRAVHDLDILGLRAAGAEKPNVED